MGHPRALTATQEKRVINDYTSGKMLTGELADKYAVHPDTIRNVLRRKGIELRPAGGLPKELRR